MSSDESSEVLSDSGSDRSLSDSYSRSGSMSLTPSGSRSGSGSRSLSPSRSGSGSLSPSRSMSRTPSGSRSPSRSMSRTPSGTGSRSPSGSRSRTPGSSRSGSFTPSGSRSPSGSYSRSVSRTPSGSRTGSRSPYSGSVTGSERSLSDSRSRSPSGSRSMTPSGSERSYTPSRTPSGSYSRTPSGSYSRTPSGSYSRTPSGSYSRTPSQSGTYSEESYTSSYSSDGRDGDYSSDGGYNSSGDEYSDERRSKFARLPQAVAYNESRAFDDPYAQGIQDQIDATIGHICKIQRDELEAYNSFAADLSQDKADKGDKRRKNFLEEVAKLRNERIGHREALYDAIKDRDDLLEAREIARVQERRAKNQTDRIDPFNGLDLFVFGFFIVEIIALVLYIIFMDFTNHPERADVLRDNQGPLTGFIDLDDGTNSNVALRDILSYPVNNPTGRSNYLFNYAIDISIMVFVGFGLLMGFLRKYTYTTLGNTLLVGAFAFHWALIWLGMFDWAANGSRSKIDLEIDNVIGGLYAAAAAVIGYGAMLGRVNAIQTLIYAFTVTFLYSVNYYICIMELEAADWGGAITIHLFAGLFGFAASFGQGFMDKGKYTKDQKENGDPIPDNNQRPSYFGETLSLIGLVLLFVYFPSFNAALSPAQTQYRVIINTVLSMIGSSTAVLALDWFFCFRSFRPFNVSNASISGAIAMGSAHSVLINGFEAIIVGMIAGVLAWLAVRYLTLWFNNPEKLPFPGDSLWGFLPRDTRAIFASHAIPGLYGALAGIVASGAYDDESRFGKNNEELFFGNDNVQAARNVYAMLISIGIAVLGGIVLGFVLWVLEKIVPSEYIPGKRRPAHRKFHDETSFRELPLDIDY